MKKLTLVFVVLINATFLFAQLVVEKGGELKIDHGSIVFIEGEIDMYTSITGDGVLALTGVERQVINTRGFDIPNLVIKKSGYVELGGDLVIAKSLYTEEGKLKCENFDLILNPEVFIKSKNNTAWIETDGRGAVRKKINGKVSNYFIPLGSNEGYTPMYLTAVGNSKNSALIVRSTTGVNNRSLNLSDYLNHSWKIELSDIKGEVITLVNYTDYSAVKGREHKINAFYQDGRSAEILNASIDRNNNIIKAIISGNGGEIFAVNSDRILYNSPHKISMMPNPAYNYTIVKIYTPKPEQKIIIVTDGSGRVVKRQIINTLTGWSQHTIDLQGLSMGYYSVGVSGFQKSFSLLKR